MKEEKKLVSAVRPRGTDEACVIQVIRTKSLVGAGTTDDLSKIYEDFHIILQKSKIVFGILAFVVSVIISENANNISTIS